MMDRDEAIRMLDLYLDGMLDEARRAEFEAAMNADPFIREQADLQRSIDAALLVRYETPADLVAVAPSAASSTAPRRSVLARIGLARIAAVLLLSAAAGWVLYFVNHQPPDDYNDPGPIYASLVRAGFKPMWVCENDEQFAGVTRERLHQAMLVRAEPGIEVLGWRYDTPVFSEGTLTLLATVNGEKVVIFIDDAANDRRLPEHPGPGLNLFKQKLGRVMLCEVTPLDSPRVIPRAYEPK